MNLMDIQKTNYTIYIFLLPFIMSSSIYFSVITDNFGVLFKNFSTIPHLIGMMIILYEIFKEKKIRTNKLINILFIFILFLNFSSILSAIFRSETLGILHGETTYDAVKGMILYYIIVFLIFYYNYLMISKFTPNDLDAVVNFLLGIMIFIGYFQISTLILPFTGNILDLIDILDVLRDSEFLLFMDRITLSGNEPASISLIMNVLLIPYLMSKILSTENKKKSIILLALCVPILFFSRSSSVYIMTLANFLIFMYLYLKPFLKGKLNVNKIIIVAASVILFSTMLLIITNKNLHNNSNEIFTKLNYLTFQKINDTSNQSTLTRTSTIINDAKIFFEFPVFGIGNGMQGYYYNEHLESKYFYSSEVVDLYNGNSGIVNGGPFLPAFISGYGIFGMLFLIMVIYNFYKFANSRKAKLSHYYYMFIISSITFLIGGVMTSDIVSNYIAIFCMSLPFLNLKK